MFKEELQKIQGHIKEALGQGDPSGQADNNEQSEIVQKSEDVDYESVLKLLEDLSGLTYECLSHFEIIDEINERVPRIGSKCRALTETLNSTREVLARLERSRTVPQPINRLTSNPRDMSKGREDETETDYLHTYLNRVEHADMPQPVEVEERWRQELRETGDETDMDIETHSVSDDDVQAADETMDEVHEPADKTVSEAVEGKFEELPDESLGAQEQVGDSDGFFKADIPEVAGGVVTHLPGSVETTVPEQVEVQQEAEYIDQESAVEQTEPVGIDNPSIDDCLEMDSQVEEFFAPEVKAIDKMLGNYELALQSTAGSLQQDVQNEEVKQSDFDQGVQATGQTAVPKEPEPESAMAMLSELGDWEMILGSCAEARRTAIDGLINNLTERTKILESQSPEGGHKPKAKAPPDPIKSILSKTVNSTCLGGHGYKQFSKVLDDLHGRLDIDKPQDESEGDLFKQLEKLEPESIFIGNQLLDELDKIEDKYF